MEVKHAPIKKLTVKDWNRSINELLKQFLEIRKTMYRTNPEAIALHYRLLIDYLKELRRSVNELKADLKHDHKAAYNAIDYDIPAPFDYGDTESIQLGGEIHEVDPDISKRKYKIEHKTVDAVEKLIGVAAQQLDRVRTMYHQIPFRAENYASQLKFISSLNNEHIIRLQDTLSDITDAQYNRFIRDTLRRHGYDTSIYLHVHLKRTF